MQERILVTGATGFVGGWLVEELRQTKPDALLFGTSRTAGSDGGTTHSAKADPPVGITLLPCDITDAGSVADAVNTARPTRVVHLAGVASAAGTDLAHLKSVNADAAITLLRAVAAQNTACCLLLASSGYVYGATKPGVPAKETNTLHPVGAYAESKVAMENAVHEFVQSNDPHNVRVVLARAFNHTGARQTDAFVVPAFARQIARIEKNELPPVVKVGNLSALRDFLHVRDVVRAYRELVCDTDLTEPVTTVNVASGVAVTVRAILDELIAQSSVSVSVETDPARLRPSDLPECIGDYSRLLSLTGWTPTLSLSQTLRETLDYWRTQTA